jgi:glycosyltransferase 2 family protein
VRGARRPFLIFVGFAASAFFTYLAVRDVDLDLFWEALQDSDLVWLLPALMLLAVGALVRAWRWQFLFYEHTRPPLSALIRALIVGQFFNSILPARGGEVARIVVLHQETGTSRVETLGTAVVERLYDVIALVLLLFVMAPLLPDVNWLRRATILGSALGVLVVVGVIVVDRWGARPVRFVLKPLTRFRRITLEHVDRAAANLVQGLGALHRPHLAVPAFLLTIASWLVLAASFWCVLEAFHLDLGYDAAVLTLIMTTLALVIPSAPGGLGVFEAGGVVALTAYGIDDSTALSCTVVLHALTLFPFMIAGYVVLHGHTRRLRRAAQELEAQGL